MSSIRESVFKVKPHELGQNKRINIPQQFVVLDTETETKGDGEQILRLGVAFYRQREKEGWRKRQEFVFTTVNQFWGWLERKARKKARLWVFAHNMHFDFNVLEGFKQLDKRGWKILFWVIESDCFLLKVRKGERCMIFVDTTNYVKVPLAKLGQTLGLPKLEIDFDKCSKEELLVYCRRDVEILEKFIMELCSFLKTNDLGSLGYTVASTSLNIFKHKFKATKIYIHNNSTVYKLERDSYRGGRTEAFFVGKRKGKFYYLDINSMYPYIMRKEVFPTKLIKYKKETTIQELKRELRKNCVIARVEISTKNEVYGIKHKDKLIFPVGEFECVLCTPELQYALKHNHIKRVKEMAVYKAAPIFTRFVDYFYNERVKAKKNRDEVRSLFLKIILNSLYGKFGQENDVWKRCQSFDGFPEGQSFYVNKETGERLSIYTINGKAWIKEGRSPSWNTFVAIASHITAHARMYLWSLLETAGLDHLFYCDTDSLLVDEIGMRRLACFVNPLRLGALKLEHTFTTIEIRGPKDYQFDNIVKIKGVPKNAIVLDDNTFEYTTFLKTKTLLRKQLIHPYIIRQRKTLKRQYDKRILSNNGLTQPLTLPQIS